MGSQSAIDIGKNLRAKRLGPWCNSVAMIGTDAVTLRPCEGCDEIHTKGRTGGVLQIARTILQNARGMRWTHGERTPVFLVLWDFCGEFDYMR
jgi:hypothetical protein